MAAALVTVSPLMVAQSHYLSLDVPLGFAVLVCLYLAGLIATAPRAAVLAISGLALGLCITTRASGGADGAGRTFDHAYVHGRDQGFVRRQAAGWQSGRLRFWAASSWGFAWANPGFLLRADQVEDVLQSSISFSALPTADWHGLLAQRWQGFLVVLLGPAGPELVALWLLGSGLLIWRRKYGRLLVALVPPIYFVAGAAFLSGSLEGLAAVWLPAALVVSCWPLVVLCRRLPRYGWQVAAVALLGVIFCAWPLWRTLQSGYIFWQQDTLTSAGAWLETNAGPQTQVLAEPGIPLDASLKAKPLDSDLTWQNLMAADDFVLISSLGKVRKKDLGRSLGSYLSEVRPAEIPARLQLVKRFDLRESPLKSEEEVPGFPLWVSPRVDIYAAKPARRVVEPMALKRPGANPGRMFSLLYGDFNQYSRFEGTALLRHDQVAFRVLRLGAGTDRLGLLLSNQGRDLAVIRVSQGPWPGRLYSLYPGQEVSLNLSTLAWPPTNPGFYPCKFSLLRGGEVMARLDWDPLLRGSLALEEGDYPQAEMFLSRLAADGTGGFEARAMLAAALARQKKIKQAAEVIRAAGSLERDPAKGYRKLALADRGTARWDADLGNLTGYHSDLLRRASSLDYAVETAARQLSGDTLSLKGRNFSGSLLSEAADRNGRLTLRLDEPFPKGYFCAELVLDPPRTAVRNKNICTVSIWSHGSFGTRRLVNRKIAAREIGRGRGLVRLPFEVKRSGARLEARLEWESAQAVSLKHLRVGADITAHMQKVLRWYLEAAGLVALQNGRFPQAVSHFEELLSLAPKETRIYVPLARALMDTGRMDQAFERTRTAEDMFQDRPGQLAELVDLYQAMRLPGDAARVEKRLAYLKPSLKKEARFAGGLTLLGYDFPQAGAKRGAELTVNWYWRCWARPPLDYYIFVHLRGPGRTLNYDHLLDHGRLAMTDMKPGQVVRENYRLKIPDDAPAGEYSLVVGLWDPRFTGKGVPILDGRGKGREEVVLGKVRVE